ncbi:oxidoreductase [Actinorhabdospora filicis]|uniref:Oxidoreductase n=1 Tax=Actinorhabdospora filicis TaxID=1785913 RepID=A0A9W6SFX7_9ACTN|nr:NADP-dependent oxidoreductase [Actinorhabdospora filicis]GLZ75588.1 oxidoreductase [Actinorhabdospora filicis]
MTESTYKAVVVNRFGGPEVLELAELPDRPLAPGEVRVAVKAAGIQPVDASIRAGLMPATIAPPPFPITPGNELAGVVVESASDDWAPGDAVLGFQPLVAYAERAVLPGAHLVAKPEAMPWEIAGSLSASGQTAHIALEALGVKDGDVLLVHGAAGGVGTVAVQLARHRGATVIGTASEGNHAYLRELGAIPVAYGPGLPERVRAVAPGPVTVAFDAAVGEGHIADSLELTGQDASRVGTIVAYEEAEAGRAVAIRGPRTAARLNELAHLWSDGVLRLTVSRTYRLSEAAEAHRAIETGRARGKSVFVTG